MLPVAARSRALLRWPLAAAVLAVLALLLSPGSAAASVRGRALPPAVLVEMISSPSLTLDSNKACDEGPQAAYVAFRITNTSGTPQPDLRATLGGFGGGIVLSGGQAATQYVGTLAGGARRVLYWFVRYPCTSFGNSANLVVSVTNGTGTTTGSGTVTTRSMLSSQAGGVLTSGTLGPGAVVGQIIEFDVAYEFGGANVNDSYNLQVAGNPAFNAGCFQLVRMEIISPSGITAAQAAAVGTPDTPYFTATSSQGGSKIPLTVRYFFKYLCAGVTSTAKPYSNQNSGGQLKYSSNYDIFVGPTLPGATNPFAVSKSAVQATPSAGGTVTYVVTISNPSGFTAAADSIVDQLPAGVTYQGIAAGSGVTAANSGSLPAANSTGRIVFRGNPGSSYTVPPNGSLVLRYTVQVPAVTGQYTNTAFAATGITVLGTGPASATVLVGADLAVTKTGPASVMAGDTVRYVVGVSNPVGPATAYAIVLTDSLPTGMTFVSATRGGTAAGRVVTWPAIDSLRVGQTRSDTLVALAPVGLGNVTNVAAGAATTPDSAAANNNGSTAAGRVTTSVTSSIDVSPKGLAAPQPCLRGPGCKQVFTVTNASPTGSPYDLLARVGVVAPTAAVFLQVDSITGPGITTRVRPDSVRLTLAGRTTYSYTVWYRVLAGDTAVNADFLRARAAADTTLRSEGWTEIRRVFPALALSKSVSPAGTLAPGTDLTYEMVFGNTGEYAAEGVRVSDVVPEQVMFKLGSSSSTLPAGITATVEFSKKNDAAWTYTPVSGGCGAPAGYDACVDGVQWLLAGSLPDRTAAVSGTVRFVAKIR